MKTSDDTMAKIAKRHDDIPQEPLPLDGLDPAATSGRARPSRSSRQRSIRYAVCPHHAPTKAKPRTGLVALDATTLAFRDHNKSVGKHYVPCQGSGEVWEGRTYDTPD